MLPKSLLAGLILTPAFLMAATLAHAQPCGCAWPAPKSRQAAGGPGTSAYFFENTCDKPIHLVLYQQPQGHYDMLELKPGQVARSICLGKNCTVKVIVEMCQMK